MQEYSETNEGAFVAGQDAVDAEMDDLYDQAVAFVTESRKASILNHMMHFMIINKSTMRAHRNISSRRYKQHIAITEQKFSTALI
jgi:DNA segregation ATPase FtsK/SpoIIIE-like protein